MGGGGALPLIHHCMGYIICLCCGKGHGFEVGYEFSTVDVTNNYIHGVILRQITCLARFCTRGV